MRRFLGFLTSIFLVFLTACGSVAPPQEFAPDGEIVAKALLLQFRHTSDRLSQSLQIDDPQVKIAKINVTSLEPIYVGKLPAYHLQGDYDLTLKKIPNNTTILIFIYKDRSRVKLGVYWKKLPHNGAAI